jgi:hypothetical protein
MEPTDENKQEEGYEAVRSFLKQFEPLDGKSLVFLDVLIELLMRKTNGR